MAISQFQDQPLSSILSDAFSNLEEILRSEIRLAKAEGKEEAIKAAKAGSALAAGTALAAYSFGFLLLTVAYALAIVLSWWLAGLIVAVVTGLIAAILISVGRRRLEAVNPPRQSVETLKENAQWLQNQTK